MSFVESLVGGDAVLYKMSCSVVVMLGEGKCLIISDKSMHLFAKNTGNSVCTVLLASL